MGSYQFFCVLGLSVFQIEKATAAGFSIFAFLALTIPFIFLGFAAMLRSGLSLKTLREQVMRLPSEAKSARHTAERARGGFVSDASWTPFGLNPCATPVNFVLRPPRPALYSHSFRRCAEASPCRLRGSGRRVAPT